MDIRSTQNTGIACVLPAWKILKVLNRPEFVAQRYEEDEAWQTSWSRISQK
jgi:hypothetical protein